MLGGIEGRDFRSFLSPEDALRDLRKHASQGADIFWELHGNTRADPNSKTCAGCVAGSTSPGDEHRQSVRGDLRKHHSVETDRWSLRPDTHLELRKHASEDSHMADEATCTLCVPETIPTKARERCTCPGVSTPTSFESCTSWTLATQPLLPLRHHQSRSFEDSRSRSLREHARGSPEATFTRRMLSPEVRIGEARCTSCEIISPSRRRETRCLGDIVWEPVKEEPQAGLPFASITPPRNPPPVASPARVEKDKVRWRLLSQISAFPIYQGAWRESSSSVWSPQKKNEKTNVNGSTAAQLPPRYQSVRKRPTRAKSEESARAQESRRQRPQLVRSQALLEVPGRDPGKRSLSEEVRSWAGSIKRPPVFRDRSEDSTQQGEVESLELREYVTTV